LLVGSGRDEEIEMPKLWAGRGVGRRGAAPLMPPRWLRVLPPVFASWSARLPVG
jgi:hypothetical protein